MTDPSGDPTRVDQPTVPVDPTAPMDPTMVGRPVPMGAGDGGGPREPWATGPGGDDPDRRPWLLVAVLAAVVVVLVLLLALGNGDDGDDDGAVAPSTTTTVTAAPSTTEPPSTTTTAEAATTTTAEPAVTVPPAECEQEGANPAEPGRAAEAVHDAWVRGDEACAARLMSDDALAELFSRDGTGAADVFQGCTAHDGPDAQADCAFTYEGGATHFLMDFSATDGWTVVDVTQFAD